MNDSVGKSPISPKTADESDLSGIIVGIPSYNEEIAIGSMVLACKDFANRVVVVDDGSSDRTAEIAERAGAVVLEHGENRGKGAAIRTLFEYVRPIDFEALVLLDGDGQHYPNDIPQVVSPILNEETDVVIGSRYMDDSAKTETPFHRRFGQQVLDILTFGSTGTKLSDSQSGFRAFSPSAVDALAIESEGISVESEMISKAVDADLDIRESPIDVRYEGIDGQTFNPLRHGLEVLVFCLQLVRDRHPLVFFGLPGLILTFIGVAYGANALFVYQLTGKFYAAKIIASGFVTVAGLLSIFCGLVLNSISNMIQKVNEEP